MSKITDRYQGSTIPSARGPRRALASAPTIGSQPDRADEPQADPYLTRISARLAAIVVMQVCPAVVRLRTAQEGSPDERHELSSIVGSRERSAIRRDPLRPAAFSSNYLTESRRTEL